MLESKLNLLKEILGSYYKSGATEFLFHCPQCDHHKRKLSINIEKNVFKCWVCDWSGKNIYRIVRSYGTLSNRFEWKKHFSQVEIENFSEKLFGKEDNLGADNHIELPKEFISLTNKNLPPTSLYPLNYLNSRGLNKADIIKWKLGYCSSGDYDGRIIVPSFGPSGKVNYFVARSFTNDWKKYLNPPVTKNIIFNHLYTDFDEDIVVVEGIFDAFVAGPNAVPLLGSTLRENHALFQEIVKNDTPIYIALDPDAGKKEMQIINMLLKYDIEVYKVDVTSHMDVGEMTREAFLQKKRQAKLVTSSSHLLRAIQSL